MYVINIQECGLYFVCMFAVFVAALESVVVAGIADGVT